MQDSVRPIREEEKDLWCLCPLSPDDPSAKNHIEKERQWLLEKHPTSKNLFAFVQGGTFLGKYDVPFESPRGWRLWTPSVVPGPDAPFIMKDLLRHAIGEAAIRKLPKMEVILEQTHPHVELARQILSELHFSMPERRVLYARDFLGPLPKMKELGLKFRTATELPRNKFLELCGQADMRLEEIQEIEDGLWGEEWIVAEQNGLPIGMALLEFMDSSRKVAITKHIGIIPSARGKGLGSSLYWHTLKKAQTLGATDYLGSTSVDNLPMLALFHKMDLEKVGEREIFRMNRVNAP